MLVLGIDPGTRKCGYALLRRGSAEPLELGIVETAALGPRVAQLAASYPIEAIAVGSGTHAPPVTAVLRETGLPVETVDEHETTLRARARYFRDHPPRGWRRWIPQGMLLPPGPIDDYAALLIAERFLAARVPAPGAPD